VSPLRATKLNIPAKLRPKAPISKLPNSYSTVIQDFYLNTPVARPKYMRVALKYIPSTIIEYYGLEAIAVKGFGDCKINKGM
jgi:hypothetical protein